MSGAGVIADLENAEDELLTLEEFAELDLGETADLVNGKIELMGINSPGHSEVLSNVNILLGSYVKHRKFGKVYCGDVNTLVRRGPDTGRGIDLAYVSHQRLESQPVGVSSLHVAPELAIEITSPSNSWDQLVTKIREYFDIGVKEVWVIAIGPRQVNVFTSPKNTTIHLLEDGGTLSCPESSLPGFEISLEEIFEGLPALEP